MKYYKREKTEYGNYVDQAGDKYVVLWCSTVYSPDKKTPEDFGYERFEDEEAALKAWGLVPYIDPEAEEAMFLEASSAQAELPTPTEQ